MKEIRDIIRAYEQAQRAGRRAALATVVKVEGSSYRRPGARMLVTEDGHLTGAISGGCLEGDARRKALLALDQGKNKLVTYDSMDEDGEMFGIQLGCNGIVHILFEPIAETIADSPLPLLKQVACHSQAACLVTLFQEGHQEQAISGTSLLLHEGVMTSKTPLHDGLVKVIGKDMQDVLRRKSGATHRYGLAEDACDALLDYVPPPVSLVIAGAGNDAAPVAQLAHSLGWKVFVVDGRPAYARKERFVTACDVHVVKQGEMPPKAQLYMLMSHNYPYDLSMLRQILEADCLYIGILGPSKKRERMIADMTAEGLSVSRILPKLYGPAGLDIGAETAEEIALSVIAEMKAVLENANAMSLRNKMGFIHPRMSA